MKPLNCNKALIKAFETYSLTDIANGTIHSLQGIGKLHEDQLKTLKIHTIADLAHYKYFHLARAIQTLASTEEAGDTEPTGMNLFNGVDKEYHDKSFAELLDAPVDALLGIGGKSEQALTSLGVKTVKDLAMFRFCLWAEAIQTAAQYEKTFTES